MRRSGGGDFVSFLADSLPCALHVPEFRICLAYAEAQSEFSVQLGMGEKKIAAAVQAIHDGLVRCISAPVAKAHEIQWCRCGEFEIFVMAHPFCELLRHLHMLADVVLQAFHAVMANDKPQFQRTKTAPKLNVPVAVVDGGASLGGVIAQILWQDTQRLDKRFAIGNPETVAIEVGEHPLMRVEVVTVGEFDSGLQVPKFRKERGGA